MYMNQVSIKFVFKKYINDIILIAKYVPNPDWMLYKPWGYKFRKARFD